VAVIAAGGAGQANGAALHRIIGRGIDERPGSASIKRVGNVEMPDAGEVGCVLSVTAGGSAQKSKRRATAIARHHGRKRYVLYAQRSPHVGNVAPCSSMIMRDRDHGMPVAAVPAEIDCIV